MKKNFSYEEIFCSIKQNWDKLAKPLDSLGEFEKEICKIGACQKKIIPSLKKCALLVLCSDNGIVEEGVSQSGQEVTEICAKNIAAGKSACGVLAKKNGVKIITADVGMNCEKTPRKVLNFKVRRGTRNFVKEKSMTKSELEKALLAGKNLAQKIKKRGFNLICIGEMGIGNTTTSAALCAAVFGLSAEKIAGRGAGLDDEKFLKKIGVINFAIEKYSLAGKSALEALEAVGGFDIAAMAGVYTECCKLNMPVILDGAISLAAALVAKEICPDVEKYLVPSHKSREILCSKVCEKLNFSPVLDAKMALGEGSGAVFMLSLLRDSLEIYKKCLPFSKSGVEQYKRYD